MPTKDYDPIREIIEAVGSAHIWPVTRITTNTDGNITIGPGSIHDYDTTQITNVYKPVKLVMEGSLPIVEEKPVNPFAIRSVLSNRRKNAFTVVWEDGTTTVVHCQEGDEWDDEKALAMCFTKKALGNKGNFNDKFNDALNNKMKVIPEEKKTIPAREVCDCDGTCAECKEETLRSPINGQLTIDDIPNEKIYELYFKSVFGGYKTLKCKGTLKEVNDYLKNYTNKHGFGYYYRLWDADGGMYIDYGSHATYAFIPGITSNEYGNI